MSDWVKDNFEAVIGWALIVGGGVFGFVRGVWRTRSDHAQLRKEFDAHMSEARPAMRDLIGIEGRVDNLERRMDEKFDAIMEQLNEGRQDVNRLTDTVISVLQGRPALHIVPKTETK